MATIARVRAIWSGTGVVGEGVSTFYFDQADSGFISAVHGAMTGWRTVITNNVTIQVENSGDLLDDATGALAGTYTEAAVAPVVCTGTSSYAAGVGARVRWRTSGIVNGRRQIGSTFVVPLGTGFYDGDGTLTGTAITALNLGITNMLTPGTCQPLIWHRPSGGSGGSSAPVISGDVPDRVSWLRSRRT